MKNLPIYLSLLLLLTCAKEDSQDPGTTPSNITPKYILTATAGEGGSVAPSSGSFNAGTQVSITATPNSGYTFSGWSNGSSDNPVTVTLSSNTSITANFALIPVYTLSVSAEEGGSVSSEGGDYQQGTEVTITATPDEGYEFSGWSDGNTEATRVITSSEDLTLTASFTELIISYTLTVTSTEGGSISSEGGEYNEGTEITITATPGEGYRFTGWSDGNTEESITITLSEDTTLEALFELIPIYTVTVTSTEGGSVSSEGGEYEEGTEVTITATPDEGYEFSGWSNGETNPEISININEDTEIRALFEPITLSLQIKTVGQGRVIDSNTINNYSYKFGDTISLNAVPWAFNEFYKWAGDLSSIKSSENFIITKDSEVTAYFRDAPLTLDIQDYKGGSTSVYRDSESDQNFFTEGTNIVIEATPDEGYTFAGWHGSINSIENLLEIEMDKSLELRATFYKSDLEISISPIDYYNQRSYNIDQVKYTIQGVSGNMALKTNSPRVIIGGKVSNMAIPNGSKYDYIPTNTFEFEKTNKKWTIKNEYPLEIWGPRNVKVKGDNILILDGNEIGDTSIDWGGNIYFGEINEGLIDWVKVNSEENMGYFHSGSFGDFNGDGNPDVIGVSGTSNTGTKRFFSSDDSGVFSYFLPNEYDKEPIYDFDFAAEFIDVDLDGKDEILSPRHENIYILNYDQITNSFLVDQIIEFDSGVGPSSAQVSDLNNDGYFDFVVARGDGFYRTIEAWFGSSTGQFENTFYQAYSNGDLMFQEFSLLDANDDGLIDIILHGQNGTLAENRYTIGGREYIDVNLKHFIWLNSENKSFSNPNQDFIINNSEIIYLIPYLDNKILHFMGPNFINFYGRIDIDYDLNKIGFKLWDVKIPLN